MPTAALGAVHGPAVQAHGHRNRPYLSRGLTWCLLGLSLSLPARACEPARIDTLLGDSNLCPGDHLDLSVSAFGDIIGFGWTGPGTGEYFTSEPAFGFLVPLVGEYTVVAYGECGNDTATFSVTAIGAGAGTGGILALCDNGPTMDLASWLGTHDPGGNWTYFGEPHGNLFDPGEDQPGPYVYAVPDSLLCPGANDSATVAVQLTYVGPAQSVSVCSMDSALDLAGLLLPNHTDSGEWFTISMLSTLPHAGAYDPAADSSGVFWYAVTGCSTSVSITELPALSWFIDLDQDGLGDPLQRLMACEQPLGYVADSSDACGLLPGTWGDPCDDGDSTTVNDMIGAECFCIGELPTGIPSVRQGTDLRIWPRPWAQGPVRLACGEIGAVELSVMDLRGNTVMSSRTLFPDRGVLVFEPPADLRSGLFVVHLISRSSVMAATLLVH